MKNLIIFFVALIISAGYTYAQSPYEAGMQQAFSLWEEGKDLEALAFFERIGSAEKEKWVPLYHAASVLISNSFDMKDTNERSASLERAKSIIDEAHNRSADNAELITLEGLMYTAYLTMDPGSYGMTYPAKIMELHSRAIEIDPDNPRAAANKIEYKMHTARFFGEDLAPLCEQMKAIIPKFNDQRSDVPFAPQHGKERALQLVNSCSNE